MISFLCNYTLVIHSSSSYHDIVASPRSCAGSCFHTKPYTDRRSNGLPKLMRSAACSLHGIATLALRNCISRRVWLQVPIIVSSIAAGEVALRLQHLRESYCADGRRRERCRRRGRSSDQRGSASYRCYAVGPANVPQCHTRLVSAGF